MSLAVARVFIYGLGFGKLLYWHTQQFYQAYAKGSTKKICGVSVPQYLQGAELLSLFLMLDLVLMVFLEPMINCLAADEILEFQCAAYTETMAFGYELCVVLGIFLYTLLVLEALFFTCVGNVQVGSISIEISEYRVLCLSAVKQVMLCIGVATCLRERKSACF